MAHKYNLFPTHFKKIELDPASNLSVDNFKKILTTLMGQHLSLQYGQVILVTGIFSSNSYLGVREVEAKSMTVLSSYFGMKFLWLEIR